MILSELTYYYVQFQHTESVEWYMDFNLVGHENICGAIKRIKELKRLNAKYSYRYRVVKSVVITSEVYTDETSHA